MTWAIAAVCLLAWAAILWLLAWAHDHGDAPLYMPREWIDRQRRKHAS